MVVKAMDQKYQIGTDSGTILWDITAILKESTCFSLKTFNVDDLCARNNLACVNAEYALTTDIENPLIIVNLCNNKDKLIDGSHRLFKANKLGIKDVTCYYLAVEEHKKYIVDYDADLYEKVVREF